MEPMKVLLQWTTIQSWDNKGHPSNGDNVKAFDSAKPTLNANINGLSPSYEADGIWWIAKSQLASGGTLEFIRGGWGN